MDSIWEEMVLVVLDELNWDMFGTTRLEERESLFVDGSGSTAGVVV